MLLFVRLRNEEFLDLLSGNWLLSQKIVKAFGDGCPLSQRSIFLTRISPLTNFIRNGEFLMKAVKNSWDLVCFF